jgi:phospholipid transport system substrate-binding protein
MLRERLDRLLAFVEAGGLRDARQLWAFVERELAPQFDFHYMTRWVLGPRYRMLDAQQRLAVEERLRGLFLTAMVRQLTAFAPNRLQYVRTASLVRNGQALLAVRAFGRDGRPVRISFRLYQGPEGWKVFDVAADGQSGLLHYRRLFADAPLPRSPLPPRLYPGRPLG